MRLLIMVSVFVLSSLIGACNQRYDRVWKDPAPTAPAKAVEPSAGAL